MPDSKPFVVFFSWQSDSPDATNRRFIREALRAAASQLENDLAASHLRIELDEATRDVPGSPNVPLTILQKIRGADALVADITTINPERGLAARAVPNPNVAIELGYAIGELGWPRIVLLFNTVFGGLKDAPFDIDRQRISPYKCRMPTKEIGRAKAKAEQSSALRDATLLLCDALGLIIRKAPARPRDSDVVPAEVRRRTRDVEALSELLGTIHLPTMDDFLTSVQTGRIPHDVFHYWEGYHAIHDSSLFHLHDAKLATAARELHDAWGASLDFGEWFSPNSSHRYYVFTLPGDVFQSKAQQDAWKTLQQCRDRTRAALDALMNRARQDFVEIDIAERSAHAFEEFVAFHRRAAENFAAAEAAWTESKSPPSGDAQPTAQTRSHAPKPKPTARQETGTKADEKGSRPKAH